MRMGHGLGRDGPQGLHNPYFGGDGGPRSLEKDPDAFYANDDKRFNPLDPKDGTTPMLREQPGEKVRAVGGGVGWCPTPISTTRVCRPHRHMLERR